MQRGLESMERNIELEDRIDAYPEYYDYRDTGCVVYHACLSCPLSKCIYDSAKKGKYYWDNDKIESEVLEKTNAGWSVRQIVKWLGASPRTVKRLRKHLKEQGKL